jgi:hypothetical protein
MFKGNLVKVSDKLTVIADHNLDLKSIWLADQTRPWDSVYSREQSRPAYDFGIHRSYSEEAKK